MTKHRVALITDSACDIPDSLLELYGIAMVPLYVIWGADQLRDRVDIQPEQFYRRLQSDPVHPTTSQPTPQDFCAALERAQQSGASEAVIATISSGMSSTYNSAQQGSQMIDFPVQIVDTRANSMSMGWQVLAAARAREAVGTAAAMIEAMERVRRTLVTLLYVDTLDYLHRGGRIGSAARWVGTALDLKPLLYVDHESGTVQAGERTRTRRKALERLCDSFLSRFDLRRPLRVAVLHGDDQFAAEDMAERIRQRSTLAELIVSMTSPVLGVHTGPGALALCGYTE